MATWADVERLAGALPEVAESTSYGSRAWAVRDKTFAWERPLRPKERATWGEGAPDGPVLAVRVADAGVVPALITDEPEVFFTIPHFGEFPAVLVHLDRIELAELAEVVSDAWRARAPKRLLAAQPELG